MKLLIEEDDLKALYDLLQEANLPASAWIENVELLSRIKSRLESGWGIRRCRKCGYEGESGRECCSKCYKSFDEYY